MLGDSSGAGAASEAGNARDVLRTHLQGLSRRTVSLALWLLPLLALANVGVLVWSLGRIDLAETIVAPQFLVLAGLLVFVPMTANSVRLALWARFLGLNLTLLGAMRVMTGSIIANSLTPSTVGGMPIKLLFLIGEGVETRKAVTLLSLQTAEDMFVLFSMVGLCASLSGFVLADFLAANPDILAEIEQVARLAGKIAAIGGALIVALGVAIATGLMGARLRGYSAHVLGFLRSSASTVFSDWAHVARHGKGFALVNIALASLQWSVRFSIAGLVLAAFGMDWLPQLYWLLQYMVQALSSFVPTPGAAGGAEAGFLLLFSPFVELDILLPAMSTWRLLHFFLPLTGAAVGFFILGRLKKRPVRHLHPAPIDERLPAE